MLEDVLKTMIYEERLVWWIVREKHLVGTNAVGDHNELIVAIRDAGGFEAA